MMSVEEGDTKFVSKLDEASKQKAKEELHELNDADRALAVQTFRTWVLQQKDWLKTPTDFKFLLRFLRARKFSQLGARQTLENYWTCKAKSPEWFENMDPTNENVQKVLNSGYFQCSKRYDKDGRRLVSFHVKAMDMLLKIGITIDHMFTATCLFYEWLILDENVQVNGIQLFIDYKDVTMNAVLAATSNDRAKRCLEFLMKSIPVRIKHINLYNEPTFMDVILAIVKPLMTNKMVERLHNCGSKMTNVYENVEMCMLPREYLPDDSKYDTAEPKDKITDDMVSDMMKPEFLDYIRKLNRGEYGVKLDKRAKDKDVPEESFRRLKVD